jgi:ribosomal protein S6E (S10)
MKQPRTLEAEEVGFGNGGVNGDKKRDVVRGSAVSRE